MELDTVSGVSFVRISTSAAFLLIMRNYGERRRGPLSPTEQRSFSLQWEIRHSADEITIGTRVVPEDDLQGMFGLHLPHPDYMPDHARIQWAHACARTTGVAFEEIIGCPGKFLRADEYLNIPGPGTGCNGDPNISIEIDDRMRDAVRNFIENS